MYMADCEVARLEAAEQDLESFALSRTGIPRKEIKLSWLNVAAFNVTEVGGWVCGCVGLLLLLRLVGRDTIVLLRCAGVCRSSHWPSIHDPLGSLLQARMLSATFQGLWDELHDASGNAVCQARRRRQHRFVERVLVVALRL